MHTSTPPAAYENQICYACTGHISDPDAHMSAQALVVRPSQGFHTDGGEGEGGGGGYTLLVPVVDSFVCPVDGFMTW